MQKPTIDPVTRKNTSLLVISVFLTIFIAGASIYYRSYKMLLGLFAPLYLVISWLTSVRQKENGIIEEQVVTCVSVVPYGFSRAIKATFMDAEHNFYTFVIEGGRRQMFVIGVTYKLYFNKETGRYVTSSLYNAEKEEKEM